MPEKRKINNSASSVVVIEEKKPRIKIAENPTKTIPKPSFRGNPRISKPNLKKKWKFMGNFDFSSSSEDTPNEATKHTTKSTDKTKVN